MLTNINKKIIKLFCITSTVLLTNNCFASELTGANLIGNIINSVSEQEQQPPENEPKQSGQTELPKLDDILKKTEVETQSTSNTLAQYDSSVSVEPPSEISTGTISPPPSASSEAQASSTTPPPIASNPARQKIHFIKQDGTVFTPPENIAFPDEISEGWFYVTKDINSIKENLTNAPQQNNNQLSPQQKEIRQYDPPRAGNVNQEQTLSNPGAQEQPLEAGNINQEQNLVAGNVSQEQTLLSPGIQEQRAIGGDQSSQNNLHPINQQSQQQLPPDIKQIAAEHRQADQMAPSVDNIATSQNQNMRQNWNTGSQKNKNPRSQSPTTAQREFPTMNATPQLQEQNSDSKKPITFLCHLE